MKAHRSGRELSRKRSVGPQPGLNDRVAIVGTVYSPLSLRHALQLSPGDLDYLELRVDHFARDREGLLRAVTRFRVPLIITVRHLAEGGAERLSFEKRRQLFMEFLPFAAMIDVELRSLRSLAGFLDRARSAGVGVILSSHHFRTTPPLTQLAKIVRRGKAAGADIVKVAAQVNDASAVQRLLSLFAKPAGVPLSVMGMGTFGKVSRLLFARAGSVLNYGYLGEPQINGQWEAGQLKRRVAELE